MTDNKRHGIDGGSPFAATVLKLMEAFVGSL